MKKALAMDLIAAACMAVPAAAGQLNLAGAFSSPNSNTRDLAFDGTHLWCAGDVGTRIYKLDTKGNVISSFSAPGGKPTGLACDGTYLWNADMGTDMISKLDASTAVSAEVIAAKQQ